MRVIGYIDSKKEFRPLQWQLYECCLSVIREKYDAR